MDQRLTSIHKEKIKYSHVNGPSRTFVRLKKLQLSKQNKSITKRGQPLASYHTLKKKEKKNLTSSSSISMAILPKNNKNMKNDSSNTQNETLLPGLPDHLAQMCVTSLHPSILFSVCHAWRRLLYSSSGPPFFSLYAILSPSLQNHNTSTPKDKQVSETINSIEFFSFDPISSTWKSLPPPLKDPPLKLLHRHPSFLSRKFSIQSLTVSNHLVLIAGTTHQFVPGLSKPLLFHPESNQWFFGPPFSNPRRWCATGSVHGMVYMASGIGSRYSGDVARTTEKWDMRKNIEDWRWENMAPLKDGRLSREPTEAIGYKEKLYMVNVKGNAVKEGWVYDVEENQWNDMPRGMLAGWNGPAATMNEDVMYVVDEVSGVLREYDCENDCWKKVIELSELKLAEQITAGRGRVCVVCANGERIVVVDVVARPAEFWVVEPPDGHEVVALHILPGMRTQD